MQQNETHMTPRAHARHIASLLAQAQRECRTDIDRVEEPGAQALFETIAEVLGGAIKALNDYQNGTERAWHSSHNAPRVEGHAPTISDMRVDVDAAEPPPPLKKEMPH